MKYNIAINGYGRIGRCIARILYESQYFNQRFALKAINELARDEAVYHLTKYDSTHGRFPVTVGTYEDGLVLGQDKVRLLHNKDLTKLPWRALEIDAILECTGFYNDRQSAEAHIESGAKKVIFSQPACDEMDATIVYGVNHHLLKRGDNVISNASCTSNCLIPILDTIDKAIGIESGSITTIHSAMHDQPVIDAYDTDLRKTRSALHSIIPVSTSLNKGIGRVLPSMEGKFETLAIRVPTINVSIMDIVLYVTSDTSAEMVNEILCKAAQKELKGILGVTSEQLVSCDFNHDSRSAVIDKHQTRVSQKRLVKLQAWFDNEWGYSNRMLDTTLAALNK
ncbi:MAG: erythrose-4-phosphate dehydrogenase [Desulfobacteraceae bacterium]|nr:erythrose-4-phosphate dehydrogenase [Desulfobacteraceae bacterium]